MNIKIENLSLQGPINWAFKVKGGGYAQITKDINTGKFSLWYGEMGAASKCDHTIFLEVNRFYSVEQGLDWLKATLNEMNRILEIQKDCNEVKKLKVEVIRHLLNYETSVPGIRLLGIDGKLINLDPTLGQPATIEAWGKGYRLKWTSGFTCDVQDQPEKVRAVFARSKEGFVPNPEAKSEGPSGTAPEGLGEFKPTVNVTVNG